MLDYESLKIIWWLFMGVLLIGFAVMDRFDLGIGTLLPFQGRSDEERRVIINTVGPTWEGNQAWLITAGRRDVCRVAARLCHGILRSLCRVAANPVCALLPAGRLRLPEQGRQPRGRNGWDWCLFIGGTVPTLIFGVAFGNLLQGVPFHFDPATMAVTYTGSFWRLLNPFALLAGAIALSMLVMHGATFLQLRTEGVIEQRAGRAVRNAGIMLIVLFAVAGVWVGYGIDGYRVAAMPPAGSALVPVAKTVEMVPGAWLANYAGHPSAVLAPVAGFAGAIGVVLFSAWGRTRLAFVAGGVAVAGVILTAGFSMFPFIMPSSSDPRSSLTVWDAVSSHRTLAIMFWVVVIMLPVVITYTAWVYRVMRGKITVEDIRVNTHTSY